MKARNLIFVLLGIAAVGELAHAISEPMLHAHLLGRLEVTPHEPHLQLADVPRFTALPPKEAVEYFKQKTAMTPSEFGQLEARYRDKGFAIAGVTARHVLETAHSALSDAIELGSSKDEALAKVRASFADAGVEAPTDFHLSTVFDTNVLNAYGAGRYEQMTDPAVLKARPYWEYVTAGDGNVRPAHAAMNHKVYAADDPIWDQWYPPNGFNCRCATRSLSPGELRARGLEVASAPPDVAGAPARPDAGFVGSPRTQLAADRAAGQLRASAERGPLLGPDARGLVRDDASRTAQIDRFTGAHPHDLVDVFKRASMFNVLGTELEAQPAAGEYFVDWAMYSQNIDSAEQLAARIAQAPELGHLRDRLALGARATYLADYDPSTLLDPEVVYDDALARTVGVPEGRTVARSTEHTVRARVAAAELGHLLAFLASSGERATGATPVRRAWAVQDVQIHAGHGADLPDGERWKRAVRNERRLPSGRLATVVSKGPLPGWERHVPVAVNASAWDYLPSKGA